MPEIKIRKAENQDINEVASYINEFRLDNENLAPEQFIIAEINGKIAGFGRIKPYKDLFELSSIGVLEEYRKLGIGQKIVTHLIEKFPANEIWITTKVPDFFRKFGFTESSDPPEEVKGKCHRICSSVNESTDESCFMKLTKGT